MAVVTRRQLLELGLKITGAATVLGAAASSCAPAGGEPDAGDDHDHDAGSTADAAHDAHDAGGTADAGGTPDAGGTADAGGTIACADGVEATAISNNHGHALTVLREKLLGAGDEEFIIKGTSGHSHVVLLTEARKASLAAGETLTITSSEGASHTHDVTISCASA